MTDEEYERYWPELGGIRKAVARSLQLSPGMTVLDVGTGWGYFGIEMAKQLWTGRVVGIDITSEDKAREMIQDAGVSDIIEVRNMDATRLSFRDNSFDLVTSFLGIRDIHMTRGEKGVRKALKEMIRVTKPQGRIVICETPPEDMETEDQMVAVEVEGEVFGAVSLPKKFYNHVFQENNVALTETRVYYTHKKLTANQARTELAEGIEIARRIYGRDVQDFADVWRSYGKRIETFGYGMYSKIVLLFGEKASVSNPGLKPEDIEFDLAHT